MQAWGALPPQGPKPTTGSPAVHSIGVTWIQRLAALMGLVALVATMALAPTVREDAAVGALSTSMVEMLEGENSSGVVTLAELRDDVLDGKGSNHGAGIDVALIDTGVAPVAGLDGDKVLHGPDLSMEAGSPEVAFLDTYGHGTHMAGIIAGERAGHEGIAPNARIVSLKVAGHDGVTTVPQVVAAVDWVVDHKNSDGLNIRVLNLSLGQQGVQTHVGDLLSAAVERAWHAGIVVVVAAGNDGDVQGHLDSPAVDPYVIAVGAVDSTAGDDDRDERAVPGWSGFGDGTRNPDFVAQGRSIASYRVPGSTVDLAAASARYGDDLFRGSGTSQAAAVTSGLAAALLSDDPGLTPNQVKATIERESFELDHVSETRQGEGHLDGEDTLKEDPRSESKSQQSFTSAAGAGTGILAPTGATWSGGTWSGGTWSGATWSGATWSGGTWSGATWSGATWSGATWSGATWSGATWSGGTWSGATWSGATWSGATWSGATWSGTTWS